MNKENKIREIAVNHHHKYAEKFFNYYEQLKKDKYKNAFTYGRYKLDNLIKELIHNEKKNSKFLDVGCGTGEHLNLAKNYNYDPYGVEPAEDMIKFAKNSYPEIKIKKGLSNNLEFEDNFFDIVLMVEVLRYLDKQDIEKSLKEARRVLKPGGKIIVTLVNKWSLDFFFIFQNLRKIFKKSSIDEINPHCEFYTPKDAENLFRKIGFVEVKSHGNMFAILRIAYKLNKSIGYWLAKKLDNFDDKFHSYQLTKPFAGHLILTAKK
tara:strand:- start:738 stop:1529 length:792 start_codon:yes stop_codon:yes gene_type:complete